MHFGLGAGWGDAASVYDLNNRYERFEAWIGVPDNRTGMQDRSFSIRLDGKLVQTNEDDPMKSGDPPIHISIDVTGAQSLQLKGSKGIYFGEPVLYKSTPTLVVTNVANLVAPLNGTIVSSNSVSLLWNPVDASTSYGIEIVCTKGNAPHIYSLNATGSTTRFDLSGVANGEYHWSVIAFDRKGVMGKFSKDRTFVVAR